MKSPDIKTFAEIFGGVAVIVSLFFFAYELKRANDIAEAEATATIYLGVNDFLLAVITDQSTRKVLRKVFGGISESLTDDEQMQFVTTMTYIYNVHEVAWQFHQKGLISDENMVVRFAELCRMINGSPVVAENWANRRDIVLPGFYGDVSRECELAVE